MIKALFIGVTAIALTACGSTMNRNASSMGNTAETRSSATTGVNNPAAVTPGQGSVSGASGAAGSGSSGSGSR